MISAMLSESPTDEAASELEESFVHCWKPFVSYAQATKLMQPSISAPSANQRHLRAFPQDYFAGVLPGGIPKEDLHLARRTASRLDNWIRDYNLERTHQGRLCCGRTPMVTMIAGKEVYDAKITQLN